MEDVKGPTFVERRLKRYLIYYFVSFGIFLIIFAAFVLIHGYADSLENGLDRLRSTQASIPKVREAKRSLTQILSEARSILPPDQSGEAAVKYLYAGVDTIKSQMGKGQCVTANPEDKGDELIMNLVITGPVGNYQGFIDNIGKLEAMRFPFVTVENVSLKGSTEAEGDMKLTYEVKCTLSIPKSGPSDLSVNQGQEAG